MALMLKKILFCALSSWSVLTTAQPLQNSEELVQAITHFLHEQADSYAGTLSVHVHNPPIRQHPQCDQLQTFFPSGNQLRSRMTVSVRCLSPATWTINTQVELSLHGFYYVANKTIAMGDTISLDDLTSREGDLLRLPANTIIDPSHIIGYIAAQRINVGSTLRNQALKDPQSVQRGQKVRTIARGIGFVATGEGQALQDGSPGSQIQVRAASGQLITGTVIDAQTVQVIM